MDLNMSGLFNGTVRGLNDYSSDEELAQVPLFKDYSESLLEFAYACCVIFMIIGIPGNLITIVALARCRKVRNATAVFIMNLSLSDFLFCCFNLQMAAITFRSRSWPHGKVLCQLFPLARYGLVAVSLFTVLAITINRFIMISHPILYPKIYTKAYISIMIAFIWIFSFGALIPTYLEQWGRFSLHPITGSCTIVPDEDGGNPKQIIFIVAFALPSIAITLCYARILWIVRKQTKKTKTERPMRIRPVIITEPTITELPETSIPSVIDEFVERQENKKHLNIPCFYSAELSTSYNDSASNEDTEHKSVPEFRGSTLSCQRAHRVRNSFITTFKRSTAFIKPRLPTNKDKKLLTMIVAIITAFLICHLPITLTKTIFSDISSHPSANIAGYLLIYMTPCINPIIYVVMSVEYRQAYKNLFKCR